MPLDSKPSRDYRSNVEGLPKRFYKKGFSNFNADNGRLLKMKEGLKKFALDENEKRSLVLCGNVGSGKTHLAISVLKNLPPKKHPYITDYMIRTNCLFLNADQFFMQLQNVSLLEKTKDKHINDLLRVNEIVCLDDLSKFNFTPAKTENLYYFVNQAYMNEKRFIITTNYDESELEGIDPRIYSRIAEMSLVIKFTDKDYRVG